MDSRSEEATLPATALVNKLPWREVMYTLNAPAIVAAEKNTAMREPSSERLYQLIAGANVRGDLFLASDKQQTHHDR
jgi:hypothetical protein